MMWRSRYKAPSRGQVRGRPDLSRVDCVETRDSKAVFRLVEPKLSFRKIAGPALIASQCFCVDRSSRFRRSSKKGGGDTMK